MSKLKITDLTFFEADFNHSGNVKGGISSVEYPPIFRSYPRLTLFVKESEVEILEEFVGDKGERITYFFDNETDRNGVILSKETGTSKVLSGVAEGNISNGKSLNSFALASS